MGNATTNKNDTHKQPNTTTNKKTKLTKQLLKTHKHKLKNIKIKGTQPKQIKTNEHINTNKHTHTPPPRHNKNKTKQTTTKN